MYTDPTNAKMKNAIPITVIITKRLYIDASVNYILLKK